MSRLGRTSVTGAFLAWLSRRRFPTVFAVTAGLFVLNVLIPDAIPFVDELILGAMAALLAAWKRRGAGEEAQASTGRGR